MKEYLVFRLYGPFASWGDIAVGEYRPSFSYPSKSAICGLVAAAMGIERNDDEKHISLGIQLQFALSVIWPGSLLRDYHTIQTPGNTNRCLTTRKDELSDPLTTQTILSSRDYRVDAVYDICLSLDETGEYKLSEIEGALKSPIFTLYLGRKSCVVAFPLAPQIFAAESAVIALTRYRTKTIKQWQGVQADAADLLLEKNNSESVSFFWEEESTEKCIHIQTRRDSVLSRRRWQFSERQEKYNITSPEKE